MLGVSESRSRRIVGAGLTEYRRVITASLYLFGMLAVASFVFQASLSRAIFVTTLPIGVTLLLGGRWLARGSLSRLRSRGRAMSPALIIGNGEAALDVVREMRRNVSAGYQPVGVCVLDGTEAHVVQQVPHLRVMGHQQLERAVRSSRFASVIVTDGLTREESRDLAWRLENRAVELMFVPRVVDVAGPRLKVQSAEGLSLLHVDLPRFSGWKLVLKRAFDIAFAAVALLFLAPIFAVVAVLIKLDDGGPVLFRQERVGRYGEPFVIHKFRTMCLDAEDRIEALIAAAGGKALLFKMENDPRITRIGKLLRKFSIDELPQFWSVLRGGMSVVGPRPQVPREVAEYTDMHHRRLLIKPGITGLWQVSGRSDTTYDERVALDRTYVETRTPWGDLCVLFKTVKVVLQRDGAR
jgi:exopolysaccharide biosynthesis polyprenyl glycosylphosphotransferase